MILINAQPYIISGYRLISHLLFTDASFWVMLSDISCVRRFFGTRSPVSVKLNWSARLQGCNITPFILFNIDLKTGTAKPNSTSRYNFLSSSSFFIVTPLWFLFSSCASSSAIFSSEVNSPLYLYSILFWWSSQKNGNKSSKRKLQITFSLTSVSGPVQTTITDAHFNYHFLLGSSGSLVLHPIVTRLITNWEVSLLAFSHHNSILSRK